MCSMRDFGTLGLHQIPPSKAPRSMWKRRKTVRSRRWWKTPGKQCLPDNNSTDAHTRSQILWQHTSDLHRFKPDRVPALRGVRRSGFLALAKGYLQQIPLAKGKSVSSIGVHSIAGPMFRSSFVLAFLSYWSFACLFLFLFLYFGFVWKEWKKQYKVGWLGR